MAGDPDAARGSRVGANGQRSVADPDLALLGHGEAADDVQASWKSSPLPFRTDDQAMHLARTEHEIKPIDGADSPEAQAHA